MKIFISWSGDKSRQVAEALRDWLPNVIQGLAPWISSSDIEKGATWRSKIAQQLDSATVGIICLTSDNLEKPWLLFEAGAISKKLDESFVCTYLLDIDPSDVKEPLAQFQATKATKNDTRQLLQTVNRAQGESALSSERVDKAFDKWWADLEERLSNIPNAVPKTETQRPEREMIEEILLTVRHLSQTTQVNKLNTVSYETPFQLVEQGKEVAAILKEVQRLNRPLVLMALEDARHLDYSDGVLFATFDSDDQVAQRIRNSVALFKAVGERLFGYPINVEVRILKKALEPTIKDDSDGEIPF